MVIKKIIFYFVIFFTAHINSFSQSGWYWQNQTPQTNNLLDVIFINENTGYAAGYGSTVLKTIDAGLTWIPQQCNGPSMITSIYFINQNTGYLCGFSVGASIDAKVMKTTNSGINWYALTDSNTMYHGPLNSIYFINEQTGFLGGRSSHQILRTTNSGQNWFQVYTLNGSSIYDFDFINQQTGFAVTEAWNTGVNIFTCYVLKTTNSGVNWSLNYAHNSPTTNSFDEFYKIKFTDENTGYVAAKQDTVFKTTNSGINWFKVATLIPTPTYLRSIYFNNNETGYVSSSSNYINKTTNGGISWIQQFF